MKPYKKKAFGFGKTNDGPQMFKATCVKCKSPCEVPFKPTGRKPVLCHDCFKSSDQGARAPRFDRFDSNRDDRRGSFGKPSFRDKPRDSGNEEVIKQLKALNEKMDELIELIAGSEEQEED